MGGFFPLAGQVVVVGFVCFVGCCLWAPFCVFSVVPSRHLTKA